MWIERSLITSSGDKYDSWAMIWWVRVFATEQLNRKWVSKSHKNTILLEFIMAATGMICFGSMQEICKRFIDCVMAIGVWNIVCIVMKFSDRCPNVFVSPKVVCLLVQDVISKQCPEFTTYSAILVAVYYVTKSAVYTVPRAKARAIKAIANEVFQSSLGFPNGLLEL